MIAVYIVDDHALIREGIKRIVLNTDDMQIVGEAGDGQELLRSIADDSFGIDVLLLDISLPGRNGIDILKQVKSLRPALAVLMLSIMSEEEYALRALRAGAAGFMRKESTPDELIDAIRKIHGGGKYISATLAEKLIDLTRDGDVITHHQQLSDRELQVLGQISAGKTISEIARDLSLSVKTISNLRLRLLKKMGMSSNAQLMHYTIENNLKI
ncbi:MAG: response regulator transcription factor [Candidatus Neomarinimicrobiota bacterium]